MKGRVIVKRILKGFKPRFTRLSSIQQVTPEGFARTIKDNPNQILPDYVDELEDLDSGITYMIKMEFGGWEITAAGFKALAEFFKEERSTL